MRRTQCLIPSVRPCARAVELVEECHSAAGDLVATVTLLPDAVDVAHNDIHIHLAWAEDHILPFRNLDRTE